MKVILSIKPEYADKILDGSKRYEFRKVNFALTGVKSVIIYATKPIGKVVGEFEIDVVHIDSPKNIWAKTKNFAGVKKSFFDAYYQDRDRAVAIGVGRVNKYDTPMALEDFGDNVTPPQSFRYIDNDGQREQLSLGIN